MMGASGRSTAMRRERAVAGFIPFGVQVNEHSVRPTSGDYVQVFRLAGASFECADDMALNVLHERLNVLWRNLASSHLAVWTHVVRRRDPGERSAVSSGGFAGTLHHHYVD